MIRYHNKSIDHRADIVHKPVDDGLLTDLEQRFGEILRQRVHPRCISGSKNDAFHTHRPPFRSAPSAESHKALRYLPRSSG